MNRFISKEVNSMNHDNQSQVLKLGNKIMKASEKEKSSLFQKNWWYQKILEWSMKKENFKTQMFRFVDVLPYLKDNKDLINHLEEYFKEGDDIPAFFQKSAGIGKITPGLFASAIRKNITEMAKLFITGATPKEALKKIEINRKKNLSFTADLLGEATLSELEGDAYFDRYLELIENFNTQSTSWKNRDIIDFDHLGEIPKVNISVKLTCLSPKFKVSSFEKSVNLGFEKLKPIFSEAKKKNIFINLDMEQYEYKDLTLAVFKKLLLSPELIDYPHFGIVIQAYLKDSFSDLETLIEFSKTRKKIFSVRLVKGAYWDHEVIHAQENDWPIPVYTQKESTDANFEKCAHLLIENSEHIKLALGSHNLRSICSTLEYARNKNLNKNQLEIQMLYGMADGFKTAFIKEGYRVREYDTIGELIPGMAYLVRRLLENTSNQSFLKSKFSDNVSLEELFKKPEFQKEKHFSSLSSFVNQAPLDFSKSIEREKFQSAITNQVSLLPYSIPISLNGKKIFKNPHNVFNPGNLDQEIGAIHFGDKVLAQEALENAQQGFKTWSTTSMTFRSQKVLALADLMEKNRYELAALETLEAGKPWKEADGDICEAIDFCRYYAQESLKLDGGFRVGQTYGEKSHYLLEPRGVCSVIAPWNFPLAILAGMAVGPLLMGNTVVLKPAEQSSIIAYQLYKMMLEVGFPNEVVQFLPGNGETVGEELVSNPITSLITFTGSKEVGLKIIEKASIVQPSQTHVKKCVIEMGGKNALIIDSDADLDEAIDGVLHSAFGFQGQKCSACSRVFVLSNHYDTFVRRLVNAAESYLVGPSHLPESDLGPLIDKDSFQRTLKTIEEKSKLHKLLFKAEISNQHNGYYVGPHIFEVADPYSSIAKKEFFAPILDVYKVNNLDEAIQFAQNTEYGLTGGFYSRSPKNIQKVIKEFKVGNLYINRTITGAMVFRHPFGGAKLSGLGSKTGGPEYLKQFSDPRVVTENTVRRGFSPELLNTSDSITN